MVKIDKKKYKVSENNYHKIIFDKKRIIIGNTFSSDMSYTNGWETRYGGDYKDIASLTIDKDGTIYQHYDPKYHSDFNGIGETSIMINLVNEGWLTQRKDAYYNLRNEIYLGDVVNKYWRGFDFWVDYTDEQYSSLRLLLLDLMKDFNIYERV